MIKINRLTLPICEKRLIAKDTYEAEFNLKNKNFVFEPGQYVTITIPNKDGLEVTKEFSIVSSPDEDALKVAYRDTGTEFKRSLLLLSEKEKVKLSGPFGIFTLPHKAKSFIFIAGGIGISPFMSMLRSISKRGFRKEVYLLYLNSGRDKTVYLTDLRELQIKHSNFNFKNFIGKLTTNNLRSVINKRDFDYIMVSGPPGMVVDTVYRLLNLNVKRDKILTEEFTGYGSGIFEKDKHKTGRPDDQQEKTNNQMKDSALVSAYNHNLPNYEAILQALNKSALVSETDVDGNITYANDKFIETSKYSRDELMGQNHRILKSGYHTTAFYIDLWNTITKGKVWRGEIKNKAKDGTFYWVDTSIAPILGRYGKPVKYIAVRFPITEKKEAETKLKERARYQEVITTLSQKALSYKHLDELLDTASDMIAESLRMQLCYILRLTSDNRSFLLQAGFGWKKGLVGNELVVNDPRRSMAGFTLFNGSTTVSTNLQKEKRFFRSNLLHSHKIVSGISMIIPGKDNPYGVLGVFSKEERRFSHDELVFIHSVTNLLANAVRISEEKRKDEFIALASHELKTPITSLKMFAQVLEKDFTHHGNQKSADYMKKMNLQLDKLTKLIKDLLDVTRVQSGKLEFEMKMFNVSEVVDETVDELNGLSRNHKIIFKPKTDIEVYGDRDRIKQVLTNLFTNAFKYSPNADKIHVGIKKWKSMILIGVKDFGIGIPDKDKDKIFGRFFQATDSKLKTYPGLGLGLFISKEIIKRHGGDMWFNSSEGKGSTFYFTLPPNR